MNVNNAPEEHWRLGLVYLEFYFNVSHQASIKYQAAEVLFWNCTIEADDKLIDNEIAAAMNQYRARDNICRHSAVVESVI